MEHTECEGRRPLLGCDAWKAKTFEAGAYVARPLQLPVIRGGKPCFEEHTLAEKKAFFQDNLAHFSAAERRLINPHYYKVDISDDLYDTKMGIIEALVKEIDNFQID